MSSLDRNTLFEAPVEMFCNPRAAKKGKALLQFIWLQAFQYTGLQLLTAIGAACDMFSISPGHRSSENFVIWTASQPQLGTSHEHYVHGWDIQLSSTTVCPNICHPGKLWWLCVSCILCSVVRQKARNISTFACSDKGSVCRIYTHNYFGRLKNSCD